MLIVESTLTLASTSWRRAVENEGDRPVVDQSDLHIGAEAPGFGSHPKTPAFVGDALVDRHRLIAAQCPGERRAPALAGVGVERELRHQQDLAAALEHRAVEASILVGEDAQTGDLARQPSRLRPAVATADADENEQTGRDRGHPLAIDGDARTLHPLHDGAHFPAGQLGTVQVQLTENVDMGPNASRRYTICAR